MIQVYIQPHQAFTAPVTYMLGVLSRSFKLAFRLAPKTTNAQLIWDSIHPLSQPLAENFYERLPDALPPHQTLFHNECILKDKTGRADYLATAFYLMQCLQEYTASVDAFDKHGRFRFEASLQHRFDFVEENLVHQYLLNFLNENSITIPSNIQNASRLFLSYDIDALYTGWKSDGMAALKKQRFGLLFDILQAHFLKNEPGWLNIDQIMDITDVYDLKATFFWLLNKRQANDGTPNADYDHTSPEAIAAIHAVHERHHHIGIHKSISRDSLRTEAERLPYRPIINRNHYLKLRLPHFWTEMAQSGLKADASLGFAEQYGFRNSYGLPFQPYNFETGKAYPFVEVPLHLMDTTWYTYKQDFTLGMSKSMIEFMEKHRQNAIISLLWHNIYFTNVQFERHLENFKAVMSYCYEQGWQGISPEEICLEFLEKKPDVIIG